MSKLERDRKERRKSSMLDWADKQDKGFTPTCTQLPDGTTYFQMKKLGNVPIDIIPYIAGKGNPCADEGMIHCERTIFVHKDLGVDGKKRFLCLADNFGKKCPICNWMMEHKNDASPEMLYRLKPQKRQLWRVIDLENKSAGIQVWDVAFKKSFGEKLRDKIQAVRKYANFAELKASEGGKTLQLLVDDLPLSNGQKYKGVKNIEMIDREKDYPDSILTQGPNLDDILIELSYDELMQQFMPSEDHEEPKYKEETRDHGRGPKKVEVDDDMDDDDEEDEEDEDDDD